METEQKVFVRVQYASGTCKEYELTVGQSELTIDEYEIEKYGAIKHIIIVA